MTADITVSGPTLCDTGCPIHPTEAQWHVTITTEDGDVWAAFDTREKALAYTALLAPARLRVAAAVNTPAVTPYAPMLLTHDPISVRVRDVSPLAKSPEVAAQVTELVQRSLQTLRNAAALAADTATDAGTEWAAMASRAIERMECLAQYLGTEVYHVVPVESARERHLAAVPDMEGM